MNFYLYNVYPPLKSHYGEDHFLLGSYREGYNLRRPCSVDEQKTEPHEANDQDVLQANPLDLAELFTGHCLNSVRPVSAGDRYFRPSPKTSPSEHQSSCSFLFPFAWFLFRLFSKMAERPSGLVQVDEHRV